MSSSRRQNRNRLLGSRQQADRITSRLNAVYADQPSELDEVAYRMQFESVEREDWSSEERPPRENTQTEP